MCLKSLIFNVTKGILNTNAEDAIRLSPKLMAFDCRREIAFLIISGEIEIWLQ